MRIAIIADIHGNLDGLQVVLDDLPTRAVDQTVCLGDLVEGGQQNAGVVDLLMHLSIQTVRGNHDEINECGLSPQQTAWLAGLPTEIRCDDLLFTHLSPRWRARAITDRLEAWNVFDEADFRLCFIGHLHYPALYGAKNTTPCEARDYPTDAIPHPLDPTDRYIISCGAIGYPRAGGRVIRYGIYDSTASTVEFIRLEGPLLKYGICAE